MKSSKVNIFIDVYFKIKKKRAICLDPLCFKSRLRIILFVNAKRSVKPEIFKFILEQSLKLFAIT